MKSLTDYILENMEFSKIPLKESYIMESKQELDTLTNIIVKGDYKNKPQNIYDNIVKIVNSHQNNLVDAKDMDSLENGMFIAYLKGGENFNKFATIAIMDDEDNEWYILTVQLGKRTNDIELNKEPAEVKLYSTYFGNAWQILYFEHVDDDLLEALIKTENTIGKLN